MSNDGATSSRPWVPMEDPRVRWLLVGCAVLAVIVGAAGQIIMPARGNPVLAWLATAVVPAVVTTLLILNRRDRVPALALICALIYFDAVLTASLFVVGIAFAIIVPIIGVGLIQPHVRGRTLLAVYVWAGICGTLGVALAELHVPANPLGDDQPLLTVVAFGLVATAALGLMWRAAERLVEALDAAEREIVVRTDIERQLGQTNDLLQTLISSSPVATMAFDSSRTLGVWNPAAERLFGWTWPEVVGHALPVGLAPADGSPGLRERIERTEAGETIRGDRVRCRTKSGDEVIVEVHGAIRRDASGRPIGIIVQAIDVTDRSALEAQLQQAQKMEAVGQLAGGIAHDINNSLTAVGGFAELIEMSTDDPAIKADARTISDAVGRAGRLTRQLLTFARRSVLQPQPIEVTSFVSSIQPILQRLLGADVKVVVEHRTASAQTYVDPDQFEQAILNLAVNARDAMPGGGTLTIATARRPPDPNGGGARAIVTVSDTGEGIPPELQAQVFEPFFTTKERGRGSGLGLAMVYGFVTQSGGEVELRSAVGSGTSIEIRLPESTAPVGARTEPRSPPRGAPVSTPTDRPGGEGDAATSTNGESLASAPRGDETILLVEDEPPVAQFGRQVLAGLGYAVLYAPDGPSAIEIARDHEGAIGLILSDVVMPGMRGPEVAAAVRAIHPEASVLYVSGYTAGVVSDRGVLPDDVELVEKPYTATGLGSRVRAVLDARRAPREGAGPVAGER
ncbi:MAG TPA: ATP-binding protein [Candidatus Limnocylindrales bacterium]